MKLIRNNEDALNLVTDKDVTLSGSPTNETLDKVINRFNDAIEKLQSNVKWMYRYGALGSGGGTTPGYVTNTSMYVYDENGIVISQGTKLIYESEGRHKFKVQLRGGGSDTFNVSYSIRNSKNETFKSSFRLTPEKSFVNEFFISLSGYGSININVENISTGDDVGSISFNYITSAYDISSFFVIGNNYETTDILNNAELDDVLMTTYRNGVMLAVKYSIGVDIQSPSIEYKDWEGNNMKLDNNGLYKLVNGEYIVVNSNYKIRLGKKNEGYDYSEGTLYLPLASDIIEFLQNDDNAGPKRVNISIRFNYNGSDIVKQFSFVNNLIPSNMFLKVITNGGDLWDINDINGINSSTDNLFSIGNNIFNVTPFFGNYVPNRQFSLKVSIANVSNDEIYWGENTYTLFDNKKTQIEVSLIHVGIQRINFELSLSNSSYVYSKSYLIKVKEPSSKHYWYDTEAKKPIQSLTSYYRRDNDIEDMSLNNKELNIGENIIMSSTDSSKTIRMNLNGDDHTHQISKIHQMMSVGIQYSAINDTSRPILSFNTDSSTDNEKNTCSIFVYQNKIVVTYSPVNVSNIDNINFINEKSTDMYIPLEHDFNPADYEKYHLFSLYKQYKRESGNKQYKSLVGYLDGILECALADFLDADVYIDSITLYPGNYSINLLESSYFNESINTNLNVYYKAYKEKVIYKRNDVFSEKQDLVKQYFDKFQIDENDNVVFIPTGEDLSIVENIASNVDCPVLVINYNNESGGTGADTMSGENNIIKWLHHYYKESDSVNQVLPVTLKYSSGYGDQLRTIMLPDDNNPNEDSESIAEFSISIQGSSTKTYKAKNFELYAPKAQEGYQYIYSPNMSLDQNNTDSFLPENSFTLKADVVDSSHSNNAVLGKFMNDNLTKFQHAKQTGMYTNRIKNNLIGFPILLFLNTVYKDSDSQQINEIYFLGIYNFNLGRKSYNNLGYKNISNISNIINSKNKEGFCIYKITNETLPQLNNQLYVGEIQSGSNFFDFSQYNSRGLLFDNQTGMWGDLVYMGIGATEDYCMQSLQTLCQKVSKCGGFIFESLSDKFYMSESQDDAYGYKHPYNELRTDDGKTRTCVPNWRYQISSINSNDITLSEFSERNNDTFAVNPLTDLLFDYQKDLTTNVKALDFTALSEYFVGCMAFGMVDSVKKNLNVKSWNGGLTFYPAFYDMDTALGKDNEGKYINFFAFSDYWDSVLTSNPNLTYPLLFKTNIYRDYSPDGVKGFFDAPSTYLFAIAKYAFRNLSPNDGSNHDTEDIQYSLLEQSDPCNIWTKWRGSSLRNADAFMDNYFNKYLSNIPDEAFNLNYKYKYLSNNSYNTGFEHKNIDKFHGRQQNYVRDWLDNRIHILDAYFNLANINDDGPNISSVNDATLTAYNATSNKDIYILNDIFSDNGSKQYQMPQGAYLQVEAKSLAPMIIIAQQYKNRYIFPEQEQTCNISLSWIPQGKIPMTFGGSQLWTKIYNINLFITSNAFDINSNNITYLEGGTSFNNPCSSWNIECPSLRYLKLTSPLYSGNISFGDSSSTVIKNPNLEHINISNTSINLELDKLSLTTVYANNMNNGKISIVNCNKLSDVRLSGKFLDINTDSWSNNITLSDIECETVTINNNIERFPDASITVNRNKSLKTLSLNGFKHININNCENLETINIDVSDPSKNIVETLDISMPTNKMSDHLVINGGGQYNSNDKVDNVHLEKFKMLNKLRLYNLNCEYVYLPNELPSYDTSDLDAYDFITIDQETYKINRKILLEQNAFENCASLKKFINETYQKDGFDYVINNDLYITGPRTFKNCYMFEMLKPADEAQIEINDTENTELNNFNDPVYFISNLYVDPSCIDLSETFYKNTSENGIAKYTASLFLRNRCSRDYVGNVENIEKMFQNQYNLMHSSQDALTGLYYPLSGFVKCKKFNSLFSGTRFVHLTENTFSGFASGVTDEIEMKDFAPITTMDQKALKHLISKLGSLSLSTNTIKLASDTTFDVNSIFFIEDMSGQYKPSKLKSISNLNLEVIKVGNGPANYDFTKLFKNGWEDSDALSFGISLDNVFNNSFNVESYASSGMNELFNKKIGDQSIVPLRINNSFNNVKSLTDEDYLEIDNFMDWDNVANKSELLFQSVVNKNNVSTYSGISMKKKVSYDSFRNIWEKFIGSNTLSGIGQLFSNCIIYDVPVDDDFFRLSNINDVNESIKNISGLFKNAKFEDTENNEIYVDVCSGFLKNIQGVEIFNNTFEGIKFKHAIPFNFFGRRSSSGTYTHKNIKAMSECFKNISFETLEDATFKPNESYNRNIDSSISNVSDTPSNINRTINQIDGQEIHNSDKFNANGYVVSPDIFRCVESSASDISGCFYTDHFNDDSFIMTGILPSTLFDGIKQISIINTFYGLNVVPVEKMNYSGSDQYETSNDRTYNHKIYVFVPDGFTECQYLNNAFNFNLLVPYVSYDNNDSENIMEHYFLLSNNSIASDTLEIKNSMPIDFNNILGVDLVKDTNTGNNIDENHYKRHYEKNNRLNFNVMFNSVESDVIIDGINHDIFKRLKLNSLINYDVSKIYAGNFIYTSANELLTYDNMSNYLIADNNVIVETGGGDREFRGMSMRARIQVDGYNNGFFNKNSGNNQNYRINKESLPESTINTINVLAQNATEPNLSTYWAKYTFI